MASFLDRVRGRTPEVPEVRQPEPEPDDFFEEMTLQEHLRELRTRIFYSVIAVVIGFVAGLAVAMRLLEMIVQMADLPSLTAISPTESFTSYMRVALYVGIALAMPVLVYQFVRFLTPGLTRQERRGLFVLLPFVSAMFFVGVLFAFFVVIPHALEFLAHFGTHIIEPQFRAAETISFYLTLMLWIGIAFETPIIMLLLIKLGIISRQRLASYRRYAIVIVMIAAAIITPTPDPFNMLLVAIPMYALYEFGLFLARFIRA